MTNAVVVIILIAVVGGALRYILRARANGVKCIGCPAGAKCSQKKSDVASGCGGDCQCGCSGCHADE